MDEPITEGASAQLAAAAVTDLTNCDREPIHIPGAIQPHGFLLAVRAGTDDRLVVHTCSANAAQYLGRPPAEIIGSDLTGFLSPRLAALLRSKLLLEGMSGDYARFIGSTLLGPAEQQQEFQIVVHRSGDLYIIEFERTDEALTENDLNGVIAKFVASLEEIEAPQALCEAVVRQVRQLSGFDRVMLYQFDSEGHGTVLAEDRNDKLPSYLGLRFPATDIPRQARALYVLNRLRIIPDVEYTPSPLISAPTDSGEPLDLSMSILRSVSPVHRDYMRNMGTISSMSVSIVSEGRLWGLISGHHSAPRTVPYLVRSACDVLSRIVASQLLAFNKAAEMGHAIKLKSVQSQLLTFMAAGENYVETLLRHAADLLAVTGAKGAAILLGKTCSLLGETPGEPEVVQLAEWINARAREDIFATSNLSAEYVGDDDLRTLASGVLGISLSQVHRMQILWFRPEVVETVHWAGEPEKGIERKAGELHIHPRLSFASWKQIVRGHSEPWSKVEIDSALDFRNAVLEIVLKRAEELADMASELELANKELEAFSYSVSHDLRAPFRHISGFAELMLVNEKDRLSETGKRHLATIAKSAQFAGLLVDSLLNFSRITRTRLDRQPLDMTELVRDVWRDVVQQEVKDRKVEFTLGPMPTVKGDINLLRQVWRNLLSNAVKYSARKENPEVSVTATENDGEVVFSVRDNGVGFSQQYAHKLFGVFQRLHRMEDFEGTGIGLANVRRIVARHGGRTWAEGEEGKGAAFFFSLPRG